MDVLRLTLRQLQIFVAVARSGSTTAASAEIALSQSATSSAVNELERLLSLRLFDRAGKRLLLNDNGRALLPRALALLDGAAGIEQMSRDGSAQAQSLRIGASTTIGNYVLPKLLAGFMGAQQPGSAAAWRLDGTSPTLANYEVGSEGAPRLDVGTVVRLRPSAPATGDAAASAAVSGRPVKKVLEMTPVRLPKTKKSYHSKVVPAEEAAMTVRRVFGSTSSLAAVAAISAMRGVPSPETSLRVV